MFYGKSDLIAFDKMTPQSIREATDQALAKAKEDFAKIYHIPPEERTFENTLLAYDEVLNQLMRAEGPIYLLGNVSTDEDVRTAGLECSDKISLYLSQEVTMDEDLFRACQELEANEAGKSLKPHQKRFLEHELRDFKSNGLGLPSEEREVYRKLVGEETELKTAFSRNITDNDDALILKEEDLAGLDENYKKARLQEDGTYRVDLSYPSYRPFMSHAENAELRRQLWYLYNNRAVDQNLKILDDILVLRRKKANMLGYKSYSDYRLSSRMAGSTDTVMNFEEELLEKLKPKGLKEHEELLELKQKNEPDAENVQPWEAGYYARLLMEERYDIDPLKVSEYFELNAVKEGLFTITQRLMGVTFEENTDAPTWHKDVTAFDVIDHGETVGRFYFDLYPRKGKYGHAAVFPIQSGKMKENLQLPLAALVCNFPEPTDDHPSLLRHNQVVTFFHEFGHVLHTLLSAPELSSQAGFSVPSDFVETPSQLYEEWAWSHESLKLFAKHYKTGETISEDLVARLNKARKARVATGNLFQVFLGLLDMTYHGDFDPAETSTDTVSIELEKRTSFLPIITDVHFQASFNHLMGYAANYYGYLWSKVYALDLFSVFEERGIFNEQAGQDYRKMILASGDTRDPMEAMREFAGREPSQDAFVASLGL